jgi:hypothetical protein
VTARKHARRLARGGSVSAALVCPLVVTPATEIEALPVDEFLTDPTKLCNGLRLLHDTLGTGVIVTADGDPRLFTDRRRAAAAVEATRRLAVVETDAAIAVALSGPGRAPEADLLALARAFLDAGASLLLLIEDRPLVNGQAWRTAVTPAANVARFHQAAFIAVLAGGEADARHTPRGALVCVPHPGPGHGLALAADPTQWESPGLDVPVITTLGPVGGDFATVTAAVKDLKP